MLRKNILLLPLFILFANISFGQLYKFHIPIGSANNDDEGKKMVCDTAGNIYITGWFKETIDMIPGTGTYNISSNGWSYLDIFLAKYDKNGVLIWAKAIGGPGVEQVYDIILDDSANIYMCGSHDFGFDPDPGSGIPVLNPMGLKDCFFAKYTTNGNCVYAKRFGSTGDDQAFCIALDNSNNIYLGGFTSGNTDFDPSPGTAIINGQGQHDAFFAKFDNAGNYQWANQIGGINPDFIEGISVSSLGNVFVGGRFQASVDFDPSSNSVIKTVPGFASYPDAFVAKYDTNGNFLWVNQIGSTDDDFCWGVKVDAQENVHVIGNFALTVDFNPGPGVYNLVSNGGTLDSYFAKYDSNGNFIWAKSFGSPQINYADVGLSIDVDLFGDVYISGRFAGTSDFDCGPGVFNITASGAGGFVDSYLAKYKANGDYLWAYKIGGTAHDWGQKVVVNDSGYVFLAGWFMGNNVSFNIVYGGNTSNSVGQEDAYFVKYSQLPAAAGTISGPASFCKNTIQNFSVPTIFNATNYVWILPSGANIVSGNGTNNVSIEFLDSITNGQISVYGNNHFGNGIASFKTINVFDTPIANIVNNDTTICENTTITLYGTATNGSSPYTYLWNPNGVTNINNTIIASTSLSYYFRVTDTNGCYSTDTINIDTLPTPQLTLSHSNNTTICGNDSVLFDVSPITTGINYVWILNGDTIFSAPNAPSYSVYTSGNYSVITTNTFGCSSYLDTITITHTGSCDVWPGDSDNNNVVDNNDILPIGIHYGNTGTSRSIVSNTWQAFPATDWGALQSNNNDIKHVDCNGDGIIDMNDTLAINQNFSLSHSIVPVTPEFRITNPDIYFNSTSTNYSSGTFVDLDIILGNATIPATNIYGLVFDINYDASLIQS
ncbi:MAG: SBBP repeat-containing protein, partial [Bacteroidia bacterium]|nr:SBBP repeat-containing protein [Bacteroidia bacterium]